MAGNALRSKVIASLVAKAGNNAGNKVEWQLPEYQNSLVPKRQVRNSVA
jgi:hypothetical protein